MKKLISISLALALVGCATPEVTQVRKINDRAAQCIDLKQQLHEAQALEKKADEEKGWTGNNVVRGLLFWPAIIGTQMNANEAISAAKNRQEYLIDLMETKGCK